MKSSVLIETYWNVKSIVTLILAVFSCRINRNILECKARYTLSHGSHQRVLIETYWNVKQGC